MLDGCEKREHELEANGDLEEVSRGGEVRRKRGGVEREGR